VANASGDSVLDELTGELVDELTRVIWDAEVARVVVRRAGFPPGSIPSFSTAEVFWARILEDVANGKLAGGVRAIAHEAAKHYPGNGVFARYQAGVAAAVRATRPSEPLTAPVGDIDRTNNTRAASPQTSWLQMTAAIIFGMALTITSTATHDTSGHESSRTEESQGSHADVADPPRYSPKHASSPDTPSHDFAVALKQATTLRDSQEFAAAEHIVLGLLAEAPRNEAARLLFIDIAVQSRDLEEALSRAEESARQAPTSVNVLEVLCRLQFQLSQYEEALLTVNEWLTYDPNNPAAASFHEQLLRTPIMIDATGCRGTIEIYEDGLFIQAPPLGIIPPRTIPRSLEIRCNFDDTKGSVSQTVIVKPGQTEDISRNFGFEHKGAGPKTRKPADQRVVKALKAKIVAKCKQEEGDTTVKIEGIISAAGAVSSTLITPSTGPGACARRIVLTAEFDRWRGARPMPRFFVAL